MLGLIVILMMVVVTCLGVLRIERWESVRESA